MGLKEMLSQSKRLLRTLAKGQNGFAVLQQTPELIRGRRTRALKGPEQALAAPKEFQAAPAKSDAPERITVTVAYATREKQQVEEVQLKPGATIEDGIVASGIAERCPDLDLSRCSVGIHGSVKPFEHLLQEGDRVEIYRPVEAKS